MVQFTYPEGKSKALTFSYDDGVIQDRRLVELFRQYGLRGTFHLNSGLLDTDIKISAAEVAELYRGHEVACHSVTHPFLERLPLSQLPGELWEDRRKLEALTGYCVTGMSYPMGTWNAAIKDACRASGILYSRTTQATSNFNWPNDFLEWHPTCHHRQAMRILPTFQNAPSYLTMPLFYVWGHAYELDWNEPDSSWAEMEAFCREVSGNDQVWYATNGEIYRYITALRAAVVAADQSLLYNPSAETLYFRNQHGLQKVAAGETVQFAD